MISRVILNLVEGLVRTGPKWAGLGLLLKGPVGAILEFFTWYGYPFSMSRLRTPFRLINGLLNSIGKTCQKMNIRCVDEANV